MGLNEILDLIVIVLVIVYIIREYRLSKRLIKICYGLIEQNKLLKEQNDLLGNITIKEEYEKLKKKYGMEGK